MNLNIFVLETLEEAFKVTQGRTDGQTTLVRVGEEWPPSWCFSQSCTPRSRLHTKTI